MDQQHPIAARNNFSISDFIFIIFFSFSLNISEIHTNIYTVLEEKKSKAKHKIKSKIDDFLKYLELISICKYIRF